MTPNLIQMAQQAKLLPPSKRTEYQEKLIHGYRSHLYYRKHREAELEKSRIRYQKRKKSK